jgi:hypothetical protein
MDYDDDDWDVSVGAGLSSPFFEFSLIFLFRLQPRAVMIVMQ